MLATIIISSIALLVSFGTMMVLYKNRLETNRPVVTVLIESDSGNMATPLTIKVYNTGNTPALDVTLDADKKDINKALAESAPEVYKKAIYRSLSKENIISVIHNNSSVNNSFGIISNNKENTFNLHAEIPIIIKYKNIYGKQYTQRQTLIIKIMDNFAGSGWKKVSN